MSDPTANRRRVFVKNLHEDKMFMDLLHFATDLIGRATHDSLLRFKWGEYGYQEGCAAISYVLCGCLAVVNRNTHATPEDLAEMIKERLLDVRADHDDDDDDS
jgi:hypothetical protein